MIPIIGGAKRIHDLIEAKADTRLIVLASVVCTRTVKPLIPSGSPALQALSDSEAWLLGATPKDALRKWIEARKATGAAALASQRTRQDGIVACAEAAAYAAAGAVWPELDWNADCPRATAAYLAAAAVGWSAPQGAFRWEARRHLRVCADLIAAELRREQRKR